MIADTHAVGLHSRPGSAVIVCMWSGFSETRQKRTHQHDRGRDSRDLAVSCTSFCLSSTTQHQHRMNLCGVDWSA